MDSCYSIPLTDVIKEFSLEEIYVPDHISEITVKLTEVCRPGLQLSGYFGHFEPQRIQLIGKAEHKYLEMLEPDARRAALTNFFETKPNSVIISSNLEVFHDMLEIAEYFEIPILRTPERTSAFSASLVAYLNVSLAPRITRHGVLVEVYGEGMLILGESGVGKSETAIELVKRGHRLIADDAVEIKRVSSKTLVGTAPEIIRHYVELRGIGIVDVKRIFGVGAVKMTEKIDMVVNLEPWVEGKMYDRLGLENNVTEILGIEIPTTIIPVRPGRNLAIILEIAAMNNRQKRMGYNTAVEFNKRLMGEMNSDAGR